MLPWGAASALLAWGLTSRRFARGRAARHTVAGRMRYCLPTVRELLLCSNLPRTASGPCGFKD